ncbi:MAG: GLPGLI family protein [Saprospiraceae bacterium]|nr:GLPGLI family protein [Saprospiraceae bacterium]
MRTLILVSLFFVTIFFGEATCQTIEVTYELRRDGTEIQRKLSKINSKSFKASQKAFLSKLVENQKKTKHFFKLISSQQKSSYIYQSSEKPKEANSTFSTFDYYKDLNAKKFVMISPVMGANEQIEGALSSNTDWKIESTEKKEVCGHPVVKALHLKENIVAWFTLNLPLNEGPENYAGLPGLILQLEFPEQGKTITAIQIKQIPQNTVLTIPDRDKKVSLTGFKKKNQFK